MKNLLFVSVALSVFTVTSASAQKRINFLADMNITADGIVYRPSELPEAAPKSSITKFTDKYVSPVVNIATEICSPVQFKYAQLLDRNVENLTNLSLFSFIDEWWGTKYRFGGTTKKGIDCSAFTGFLMTGVFGISLPRTARAQYAVCTKLSEEEMTEGDLVFFNTRGGVSHVGVYLGEGYFVHSSSTSGVTISNLQEPYYRKRFIAGGRPDIAEDCVAKN